MPWSIANSSEADTVYDTTHPWDSLFNGSSTDVFKQDPRQQQLMRQAAQTGQFAYPATVSRETIMELMTAGPPADAGPSRPQPTIESVLDGSALRPARLYDRAPSVAGVEATLRPAL